MPVRTRFPLHTSRSARSQVVTRAVKRQMRDPIDCAQEVVGRDMTLQAELVTQRLLRHPPLAHHPAALHPGSD